MNLESNPKLAKAWVILVYPFRHALSGRARAKRLALMAETWQLWWNRLDSTAQKKALDDTYFFLPYVRFLLFPETSILGDAEIEEQVTRLQELSRRPCQQLTPELPESGVLRLTYKEELRKALSPLSLTMESEKFAASVSFDWIDLLLFPQNVGFLLLKIRLHEEEEPAAKHLNDLLYYMRYVHPPQVGWRLPHWELPSGCRFQNRELIDFLLQGCTATHQEKEPVVREISEFLPKLKGAVQRYTASPEGQVYGQIFHLFTYACLSSPAPAPPESGPAKTGLLDSLPNCLLYELATCTLLTQPEYVPEANYLQELWQRHAFAFWANWRGMALHDNVVFLATEESPFTKGTLAHNVENDYLQLYLFTLFQKVRLSMMLGELIRPEVRVARDIKEARRLWDTFMEFQNRYWFAEVTRKPLGTELYRQFQRGLGVLPVYEEVKEEVRELRDHYERKFERRISGMLNFLTFVGLPAGLLVELFSNALVREATWCQFFWVAGIMYGAIGSLWFLWRLLRRE